MDSDLDTTKNMRSKHRKKTIFLGLINIIPLLFTFYISIKYVFKISLRDAYLVIIAGIAAYIWAIMHYWRSGNRRSLD